MSTIVRYSNGSTYTIVPNKVEVEKIQDLDGQYHIPNTSIVGMMRLGLGVQRITVSGDALDMSACLWHDVVAISFDGGTSYQTVYFAGVPYTSDCWSGIYPFALSLLASPLKEQTAVRYPTTGYKWGNQSITGISQAGNVNAFPTIHYLAPLFYAPLSNTLIDFAGQSVTFTRAASKVHGGVTYGINVPIFDSGLYLASDTVTDVATWTPPASTVRTIAMQIKSRYPSSWSIGGGVNLLTANQSNAETDTTGMAAAAGTLTRNTITPIAGSGDFKIVSTGGDLVIYTSTNAAVTAGQWYSLQMLAKCVGMAGGRQIQLGFAWYNAASELISQTMGFGILCPTAITPLYMAAQAPVNAVSVQVYPVVGSSAAGEILYVDSLMIEAIPTTLTVWMGTGNHLVIRPAWNQLVWDDGTGTLAPTFDTAAYLAGAITDIVVVNGGAGADVVSSHPAGGSWVSATGTLGALSWGGVSLGWYTGSSLEGSIANLIQYPYVLTSAEYQALAYSSLSLLFNALYIGNRYAGEIVKGSDKRLLNANGSDISALLGGVDISIGASAVTIAQSQGLSARWYVEVKRTDV